MTDIKIISATRSKKEYTLLSDYWMYNCIDDCLGGITLNIIENNTESLASIYNKQIANPSNRDSILVFVHDDCVLEDIMLYSKLMMATEKFDIVGLAGIKAPITIKSPALWHLMGHPSQYSGAVAHFDKDSTNKRFMTSFGKTPERCILLDGVFLAINTKRILEKGLRFDEKSPAKFHYYDLNFCLDANKLGLKCGTWPIWVTHKSHGLEQPTQEWKDGERYFLTKYNS